MSVESETLGCAFALELRSYVSLRGLLHFSEPQSPYPYNTRPPGSSWPGMLRVLRGWWTPLTSVFPHSDILILGGHSCDSGPACFPATQPTPLSPPNFLKGGGSENVVPRPAAAAPGNLLETQRLKAPPGSTRTGSPQPAFLQGFWVIPSGF